MVTMLVSGDSWTSCWPLEERLGHRLLGWPNLVAQDLGYNLIDKSRAGSSNYRIYRKAFDYLVTKRCDIAVVFLTHWFRLETGAAYGPKPGCIYQHQVVNNSYESEYVFKNFFNGYKQYTDMLRMILSLQHLSISNNCPCYFLDTFDNNLLFNITIDDFKKILQSNPVVFDSLDDQRIEEKFQTVKQLTSAINKDSFISMESYQSLIKHCAIVDGHPVEDGHSEIAKTVAGFLKNNDRGN